MKSIIKYVLLGVITTLASCELPDNEDPKHAAVVTPDALFTSVEIALFDQIGSVSVNANVFRLLCQYQSEVTYVTESNYNLADRNLPDAHWGVLYRDVLANAKEAKTILDSTLFADVQERVNKKATIEVLEVYTYQLLVDAFGNVPYTEALLGSINSRPKYDDAKTIYYDLITRLDKAITDLKADKGSNSFAAADILYKGDVSKWIRFANSLKLRFALRLADVDAPKSSTMIKEAIASGVFTSQDQSAIFHYTGVAPYVNSYYQQYVLDKRKDYVPSNTLIDKMNELNDPRRAAWFTQVGDTIYKGLKYGTPGSYSKYSHFGPSIINATYPVIISDYVEVEFLLAEAIERDLGNVTGTAEEHYNKAITASFTYYGEADSVANYLANSLVAYKTAKGTWKEKIGTQKWLGLFDRGIEGWNEWRRLDYPILNIPKGVTNYTDIPVRLHYPYNENKMNGVNYADAVKAMGGDTYSIKVFWDTYSAKNK